VRAVSASHLPHRWRDPPFRRGTRRLAVVNRIPWSHFGELSRRLGAIRGDRKSARVHTIRGSDGGWAWSSRNWTSAWTRLGNAWVVVEHERESGLHVIEAKKKLIHQRAPSSLLFSRFPRNLEVISPHPLTYRFVLRVFSSLCQISASAAARDLFLSHPSAPPSITLCFSLPISSPLPRSLLSFFPFVFHLLSLFSCRGPRPSRHQPLTRDVIPSAPRRASFVGDISPATGSLLNPPSQSLAPAPHPFRQRSRLRPALLSLPNRLLTRCLRSPLVIRTRPRRLGSRGRRAIRSSALPLIRRDSMKLSI